MQAFFSYRDAKGENFIPLWELRYMEADSNYTLFHLRNKEKKTATGCLCSHFKQLENLSFFYRIHNSYAANLLYVQRIENTGTVILTDGTQLPVSPAEKEKLNEKMRSLSLCEIFPFLVLLAMNPPQAPSTKTQGEK